MEPWLSVRSALLVAVLVAPALAGCLAATTTPGPLGMAATIRWTSYSVPHILAKDWRGLGFGDGYAAARADLCTLAEDFVTVNGQRSAVFGPEGTVDLVPNDIAPMPNERSDVFFRFWAGNPDQRRSPLTNASAPARDLVEGFAAGYNAFLAATPSSQWPAPCRGAAWVRPITTEDLDKRVIELQLLASSLVFAQGFANDPPLSTAPDVTPDVDVAGPLHEGIGSNAYAYGRDATANGRGLLLGNPHFPWTGPQRLHAHHLTIPGVIDVEGASLLGVPLVLIGFNEHVAWSHTVSTARRFTLFELSLVPGQPTSYLVDGQAEAMQPRAVRFDARAPDGGLEGRDATVWVTRYGPVVTRLDLASLNLSLPWTPARAFALKDVNAHNDRLLEQFLRMDTAPSFDAFLASLDLEGIPWVNTIAASPDGRAFYGDVSAIPNVSDAQLRACAVGTGLGPLGLLPTRLVVLDGARSSCDWPVAPGAAQEGILPPGELPRMVRTDYVLNANDSHWLPHPGEPLEGYPQVVGDEGTARSLRTRMGYTLSEERLAGEADCTLEPTVPCDKMTPLRLEAALFDERSFAGELVRDDVVQQACGLPVATGSGGQVVDLTGACAALRAWDLHANPESRGLALFERWAVRALGQVPPPVWSQAFDARDPIATPRGLVVTPLARQALADAVLDLQGAGIAVDAPAGDVRAVVRNGERIPLHGAAETMGVADKVTFRFVPGRGFEDVSSGSSYIQVVTWDETGNPVADVLVTYGQSTDPESPHNSDMTKLFAAKQWARLPFTDAEVLADPNLEVRDVRG